jgi:hypothetical protein
MMKTFRVHYRLHKILDLKKVLIEHLFAAGFDILSFFETTCQGRNGPRDVYRLNAYIQERHILEQWKSSSTIVEDGEDLVFSFAIPNQNDEFDSIDENGARPWLRQFISDYFQNIRCGLMEAKYDTERHADERERYRRIEQAFNAAMHEAWKLDSPTFWIEGERGL